MKDKELLEKLMKDKEFKVTIDNDSISAYKEKSDEYYSFNIFGEDMIEFLMRYLGINANRC